MNTKLRKEAKNEFERDLFKLMNNSVFGKTMENVRKHRDIKLVTTEKRRIKLVSEPIYHTTKHFSDNLLAIEINKARVKMNKPLNLGMSILDVSKTCRCRCRKFNISLVFITQSYFSFPKDVRLNSTHYLIMKINNKRELQNIAINHSADIDYKDFRS